MSSNKLLLGRSQMVGVLLNMQCQPLHTLIRFMSCPTRTARVRVTANVLHMNSCMQHDSFFDTVVQFTFLVCELVGAGSCAIICKRNAYDLQKRRVVIIMHAHISQTIFDGCPPAVVSSCIVGRARTKRRRQCSSARTSLRNMT